MNGKKNEKYIILENNTKSKKNIIGKKKPNDVFDTEAAEPKKSSDTENSRRTETRNKESSTLVSRKNLRKSVTLALLVSLAMVLSYLESLLPPLVAIPGVKLGLANSATMFTLYVLDKKSACIVSLMRVSISALLFGNAVGFIYSMSGAALSLGVMILIKIMGRFSSVGVSVAGGVFHNIGQVCAAAMVMGNSGLLAYIAPLLISGTLSGVAIGALAGILVNKTEGTVKKILSGK